MQGELAALESQGRIAKLSSDDLQAKLMQAFADNEELLKKLEEAENALRDKVLRVGGSGNETVWRECRDLYQICVCMLQGYSVSCMTIFTYPVSSIITGVSS